MKNIPLTIILATLTLPALAFVREDTVKFNLGGTHVILIEDEDMVADSNGVDTDSKDSIYIDKDDSEEIARWAGFLIGLNGFSTPSNSLSLPADQSFLDLDYSRSIHFELNLLEKRWELGTPHVGLVTGLGFDFNRYDFDKNIRLMYNSDSVWGVTPDSISGITYRKNFLKATYIQVPLMLDFATSKMADKGVYLGAGLVAGYKIGSKMKVKYESEGDSNKERTDGDYNLNPFKLSATARLGLGQFTFFANYGLLPLFEKNKGPELHAFSVGISLIPF